MEISKFGKAKGCFVWSKAFSDEIAQREFYHFCHREKFDKMLCQMNTGLLSNFEYPCKDSFQKSLKCTWFYLNYFVYPKLGPFCISFPIELLIDKSFLLVKKYKRFEFIECKKDAGKSIQIDPSIFFEKSSRTGKLNLKTKKTRKDGDQSYTYAIVLRQPIDLWKATKICVVDHTDRPRKDKCDEIDFQKNFTWLKNQVREHETRIPKKQMQDFKDLFPVIYPAPDLEIIV